MGCSTSTLPSGWTAASDGNGVGFSPPSPSCWGSMDGLILLDIYKSEMESLGCREEGMGRSGCRRKCRDRRGRRRGKELGWGEVGGMGSSGVLRAPCPVSFVCFFFFLTVHKKLKKI